MTKEEELLNQIVDAWESLKGGRYYDAYDVNKWLSNNMKPVLDKTRKHLKREIPNDR